MGSAPSLPIRLQNFLHRWQPSLRTQQIILSKINPSAAVGEFFVYVIVGLYIASLLGEVPPSTKGHYTGLYAAEGGSQRIRH